MAYFDKYGVEFSDDRKILVRCPKDFEGEYIIPFEVTHIGMDAFQGCKKLSAITLSSRTTVILDSFFGCDNLQDINVDGGYNFEFRSVDGVLYSEDGSSLVRCPAGRKGEFTIPDFVEKIDCAAFDGCSGLNAISVSQKHPEFGSNDGILFSKDGTTLIRYPGGRGGSYIVPENVILLESHSFYNCALLTFIELSKSVKTIQECAFSHCNNLQSINIGDKVEWIEYGAFEYCNNLSSIVIPNTVRKIKGGAFIGCRSLTMINVDKDSPYYCSIDGVVVSNNKSTLVQFPSGKKGVYAIPEGIKWIEKWAFADCTNLISIKIPNTILRIENGAFYGCDNLKEIYLPANQVERFSHREDLPNVKLIVVDK